MPYLWCVLSLLVLFLRGTGISQGRLPRCVWFRRKGQRLQRRDFCMPDPMQLIGKVDNTLLAFIALIFVAVATLATNVAANAVATNMALISLWPQKIEWKTASIITGIVAVAMCPWKLLSDYASYVFTWLIGYQIVLGPIMGILLLDYWVTNKGQYVLEDLYDFKGRYKRLWCWEGFVSLICGTAFALSGLFIKSLSFIYDNGFITSMIVSGIAYYIFSKVAKTSVVVDQVADQY